MKIVVINPTYNERGNIEVLITRLRAVFATIYQHTFAQLVVDDSSPDGTGDIVRRLQKRYPDLYLLQKSNSGLGAAYIAGIHYAQNELRADSIVQIDSDLQHDPNEIPRFLEKIDQGYEYVQGHYHSQIHHK